MTPAYPPNLSALAYPHIRAELLLYLDELSSADPRQTWRAELEQGLISGVDQVIHFLFDDHDFDQRDVGSSLFDMREVGAVGAVKVALGRVIDALPHGGDDEYATHPLWATVREAAVAAHTALTDR
jgi:hypothetical protein